MPLKEFIVTVADFSSEYTLNAKDVHKELADAVGYNRPFVIESVRTYNPDDERWHSKISAITAIREALDCELIDAKFLIDNAATTGSSRWGKVRVIYRPSTKDDKGLFQVTVND